jgi:hypothetical protein
VGGGGDFAHAGTSIRHAPSLEPILKPVTTSPRDTR